MRGIKETRLLHLICTEHVNIIDAFVEDWYVNELINL